MAKNVLPVDFQDDILTEDMDGRRRYKMITNADGTVSFVDATEYTQVGNNFGQAQINATNEAVNESADKNKIIDTKADLMANTQAGMIAGASAVKAAVSELTEKRTITPTPIKELALANFKCSVKTGNVNINGQIMCSGSSAVQMKNGKDLLVGLPKPADGMIVFHAIPWNNNQAASNNLNIPLRLCISADGKMCSYFPSALEQISVGMPISINVSYFTND